MRLISIEDYADWKGVKIQEVYLLVNSGKLKSLRENHSGLKRLTLIYVDQVPDHIPSLDANLEYMSQKKAAFKLGVSVDLLRKKLRNKEIYYVTIKGCCFIPMDQFPIVESHFSII